MLRKRWPDLAALMAYVLLSMAYLWPLVRRFGTMMAGDGFDRYVFQWTNWWVTRALSQGQSPYHTEMMFHPSGVGLHFLSFSWLNTFVWWPLQALVGHVAAYNFTVWWSWPLAGFGAYLLGREVFGDRRASFIAGLVFAFYPYHFAQRNHLNLLSIQWIPFSLLYLIRAMRTGRRLDGCLSGLFFACSGLSGWHLMTLGGMLGGMWLLYGWLTERSEWSQGAGRALIALVVTAGLLTGPLLAPVVYEIATNPESQAIDLGKETETQTDLAAYILPNLYHPLWGHLAAPIHGRFLRNKDHSAALGYVPLALVGYGLLSIHRERRIRFWLVGLAVFWFLALGPFPRINGQPYPTIPLPYRLAGWTLPVSSLRNPERFNIIVGLCVSMVAGVSTVRVLSNLALRRATAAFIVLSGLVLLEYWSWPFPTRPLEVPAGYQRIATDPGDFAIVDLPISNDLSKQYMVYQTVHRKATVTGHVSRPPDGAYDFIEANGLLRAFLRGRQPDFAGNAGVEMAALADAGVRYVVVHKEYLSAEALSAVGAYLTTMPVLTDDELIVFRTAP
jgi:hypothetical protein